MTNNNDAIRAMFADMSCHQSNAVIDAIADLYSVMVPRRAASRVYLKAICAQYNLKLEDLIEWCRSM